MAKKPTYCIFIIDDFGIEFQNDKIRVSNELCEIVAECENLPLASSTRHDPATITGRRWKPNQTDAERLLELAKAGRGPFSKTKTKTKKASKK